MVPENIEYEHTRRRLVLHASMNGLKQERPSHQCTFLRTFFDLVSVLQELYSHDTCPYSISKSTHLVTSRGLWILDMWELL